MGTEPRHKQHDECRLYRPLLPMFPPHLTREVVFLGANLDVFCLWLFTNIVQWTDLVTVTLIATRWR